MKDKILAPITFLNSIISKGHHRSVKAKKNIIASFLLKGVSIAISFILVPLTIHYVNPTQYGIWLTLSSIIAWLSFFDIGFGNGLRNKFAESVAKGEHEKARIYVSTTYAILSIIIAIVLILFFCINPFLNWSKILNTPSGMAGELSLLALIVFVFFCLQFILQLIITVMIANQQPAKGSLFNVLGSLFSLAIIFILTKTTSGNLVYLGIVFSAAPVVILIVSSIWYYTHEYRRYAPSIKYIKFHFARNLMSIGLKFFIIQIGALVLLQTDNIIIIQIFSSKEVTTYNIAYKLFSVIVLIFSIIMSPLWSAFTDAYTKNDLEWISHLFNKMQRVCLLLLLFTICLLALSPFLFKLWVGDKVQIPFSLSITMAIYAITHAWLFIPCFLLNGIGKIKLQLYLYVLCIFLDIPFAIILGKTYGLPGIAISNVIVFVIMSILLSIQCKKIINNTASGIWAE
jgi:O-antigen/teichoic acid export membrane protein